MSLLFSTTTLGPLTLQNRLVMNTEGTAPSPKGLGIERTG
jgi:2,4-dienoyl-CoA reductase-like NADH-dependent reductase (Old Yellow Enzyme family)